MAAPTSLEASAVNGARFVPFVQASTISDKQTPYCAPHIWITISTWRRRHTDLGLIPIIQFACIAKKAGRMNVHNIKIPQHRQSITADNSLDITNSFHFSHVALFVTRAAEIWRNKQKYFIRLSFILSNERFHTRRVSLTNRVHKSWRMSKARIAIGHGRGASGARRAGGRASRPIRTHEIVPRDSLI